jgi:hypothetical protein
MLNHQHPLHNGRVKTEPLDVGETLEGGVPEDSNASFEEEYDAREAKAEGLWDLPFVLDPTFWWQPQEAEPYLRSQRNAI